MRATQVTQFAFTMKLSPPSGTAPARQPLPPRGLDADDPRQMPMEIVDELSPTRWVVKAKADAPA